MRELTGEGSGAPFFTGGRQMKEWLALGERWLELAKEALELAKSAKK